MQTIGMTRPAMDVQAGDRLLIPWVWLYQPPSPEEPAPEKTRPGYDPRQLYAWPVLVERVEDPQAAVRVLHVRGLNSGVAHTTRVLSGWELCLYLNDPRRDGAIRYISIPAGTVCPGDCFLWRDHLLEVIEVGFHGAPEGEAGARARLLLSACEGVAIRGDPLSRAFGRPRLSPWPFRPSGGRSCAMGT